MKRRDELIVFTLALALYALTYWDRSPFTAHVYQAVAFLHGHAWIDCPDSIERALVNGRRYQLHPPMPAFMLMPFAAVWGDRTNQNWFAIVVGALDVMLAWRLLGRFECPRIWLTAFFATGTIIWYETINGSSWEVSMLVAVLFTLLALNELFSENERSWLVGLWAGAAALSRYDLVIVWPVYVILAAWLNRDKPFERTELGNSYTFAALRWSVGFGLAAIIYVWFNWVRYGTITDVGMWYYNPVNGNLPVTTPPTLFAWRFFPGNFYTLFFMAPRIDATFPYIHPVAGGQSILTTSPAFLLALRASWTRVESGLMAVTAIAVALPVLFYVGNGMSQFGTRHFVHVFPFLLVLIAMGNPKLDQMGKVLIVASIGLITLGIYSVRMVGL